MSSGLEAALGKAISSGSAKAVGWGASFALRRINDARAAKRLEADKYLFTDLRTAINQLEPAEAQSIIEFLSSPEANNVILQLATAQLLTGRRDGVEKVEHQARAEIRELLKFRQIDPESVPVIADAILRTMIASVQTHLKEVAPSSQASSSPAARAAIIRSATDLAATSSRNADLLRELTDLADIHQFETDYQQSIREKRTNMRITHTGTSKQIPYDQLFVEPELRESGVRGSEATVSIYDLVRSAQRSVILGDPGGGKTTTAGKLLLDLAMGVVSDTGVTAPLWITLRDYAGDFDQGLTILEHVHKQCRLLFSIEPPVNALDYLLMNGRAMVIFDGLDELLDTSYRQKIVEAVEGFCLRYITTQVLVTSRRIGYDEAPLDEGLFQRFELAPFDEEQVAIYAHNWFKIDELRDREAAQTWTNKFLYESRSIPDLLSNPLMLSLVCTLYASQGYIPSNRPDVYEKCALLLFERWDKHRGIEPVISFDAHVQSAVRSIAFHLYSKEQADGLSRDGLIKHVQGYLLEKRFDDQVEAEKAATEFIDFCRGRAWVLTDMGAEIYGFTHRTFLEYFAASYLVRKNPNPGRLFIEFQGRILRSEWDVVSQLSLQILGKTIEDGADDFLDLMLDRAEHLADHTADVDKLLGFAARSLAFVVPKPPVFRRLVTMLVDHHCSYSSQRRPGVKFAVNSEVCGYLAYVSPENRQLASKYFRDAIAQRLQSDPGDERAWGLLCFFELYARRVGDFTGDWNVFWIAEISQMKHDLSESLKVRSLDYPWLAANQVALGRMRVEKMLTNFGIGSLYEASCAGDLMEPPLAYRILGRLGLPAYPGGFISLASELLPFLIEAKRPWFSSKEAYDDLGWGSIVVQGLLTPTAALRALDVLLLMPMVELQIHHMAKSDIDADVDQEGRTGLIISRHQSMLKTFQSRSVGGVTSVDFDNALKANAVVKVLYKDWVGGDVSFVSP